MIPPEQARVYQERAVAMLERAGIIITPAEKAAMELADFALNEFERTGLAIVVYENNSRYCAKELIMFPGMTCPEHRHPPVGNDPGKQETFRCRWGVVYLYTEGEATLHPHCVPPPAPEGAYTVFHEIVLRPGEQFTLPPNTRHWFQAGPDGAIVSEFSSPSRDEADIFTDPRIRRVE